MSIKIVPDEMLTYPGVRKSERALREKCPRTCVLERKLITAFSTPLPRYGSKWNIDSNCLQIAAECEYETIKNVAIMETDSLI